MGPFVGTTVTEASLPRIFPPLGSVFFRSLTPRHQKCRLGYSIVPSPPRSVGTHIVASRFSAGGTSLGRSTRIWYSGRVAVSRVATLGCVIVNWVISAVYSLRQNVPLALARVDGCGRGPIHWWLPPRGSWDRPFADSNRVGAALEAVASQASQACGAPASRRHHAGAVRFPVCKSANGKTSSLWQVSWSHDCCFLTTTFSHRRTVLDDFVEHICNDRWVLNKGNHGRFRADRVPTSTCL